MVSKSLRTCGRGAASGSSARAECLHDSVRRSAPLRGYTLVEMIIVLAVLVLLTSLVMPALRMPLRRSELRDGAKMIRAELAQARLKAIETGVSQRFRFQPGTGRFEVTPQSAEADDENQMGNTSAAALDLGDEASNSIELPMRSLPDGIIFHDQEVARRDTAPSGTLLDDETASWSFPIVFHPDGRAGNAQIRLRGRLDLYVDVTIRGVTGSAMIGELKQSETQP